MAKTIYVDADAKSGGNGSKDRPYKTIQEAIDAAQPGTTVLVREGQYRENIEFDVSGKKGAPITLKSADGPGKAVIKPAKANEDTIQIDGEDHIVIDGFELHGSNDDHRQVIHVHSVKNKTDPASNIEIVNNVIHRGAGDGIKISKSNDILVQNNEIIGGGRKEAGIDIVGGARVVIDSNKIKDINNLGINMKGGSEDIVVINNEVSGAHIAIEVGGYSFLNAYPAGFLSSGKDFEVSNVLVQGNTIIDSKSWALRLIGAQSVEIVENDFSDAGDRIIRVDDSAKFHEPWFTEKALISGNKVASDKYIVDASKKSDLYLDGSRKSFFDEWNGLSLEALLRGDADTQIVIEKDDAEDDKREDDKSGQDDKKPDNDGGDDDNRQDDRNDPEPKRGEYEYGVPASRASQYSDTAPQLSKSATNAAKSDTSSGRDNVRGTSKDEVIHAQGGNDRIDSGSGNDLIFGGTGRDSLDGAEGNDTLSGGEGDDLLVAGRDNDLVYGDDGNDRIRGEHGNDTLLGGDGNDRVDGDRGEDHLFGGDGNDQLRGGRDNDWIEGGSGNDRLDGGRHDDTLLGGSGNDTLNGGWGNDVLSGGNGKDSLVGVNGDDTMFGGAGNDTLRGDTGDDVLEGGAGNDSLMGGKGADQFVFRADDAGGRDVIADFDADENDLIVLDGFGSFGDLDSNNDGVINRRDDYVTETKKGIEIDLSELSGKKAGTHIISVSESVLSSDDFVFLA
ncbi:MAG: right-handed parallel beta-helix repeat-containing protein [Pseudomonadota bacterium]